MRSVGYTNPSYIKKADLKLGEHKPQGRKMYLHRYKGDAQPWETKDVKQKTKINPIIKGTEFFFHLDFNNLNEWELGMLFYALRPTDEFRHKLGMGKSIGLGTVRIDPVGLFLVDRKKRYGSNDIFTSKRYHQVWKENGLKFPEKSYFQEAQIQNAGDIPTWQSLRDIFKATMSSNIQQPLELLGDPSKVIHSIHTPLREQQLRNSEDKTYEWFSKNDDRRTADNDRQYLEPLTEKSTTLPTLRHN